MGEHQQALNSFEKAQSIDNTCASAWFGESVTRFELGQQTLALEKLNLAINRAPSDQRLWSARAHMLAATGHPADNVLGAYKEWGKRFPNKIATVSKHNPNREPNQRIRLGYISSDFRNHALRYFFLPTLAQHDHRKFALFGFFNGVEDEQTPLFSAHFEHWHPIRGLSDANLADFLLDLDLDVLIDLSGHTEGNRLMALASHPARYQITWYGYNCTTGMSAIDFRLTDLVMDPVGNEVWSTENLLHLPCFACYEPPANLPPAPALPALANGHITFGCLNNPQKITPPTLALWAEILKRLPNARLRLIAPYGQTGESSTKQIYLEYLESHSMPTHRVELIPKLSMKEFLEQNRFIDIVLEPTPFSGGVTTAHTLWMGIPTITLAGTLPFSRAAAAILDASGLSYLISHTHAEYVQKAIALAQDTQSLKQLRLTLRQTINNSSLMNHKNHTMALELLIQTISQKA